MKLDVSSRLWDGRPAEKTAGELAQERVRREAEELLKRGKVRVVEVPWRPT